MNPVCVAWRLERLEEAEDTDRVGAFENLRFQQYLEWWRHLGSLACHVAIVMLKIV